MKWQKLLMQDNTKSVLKITVNIERHWQALKQQKTKTDDGRFEAEIRQSIWII